MNLHDVTNESQSQSGAQMTRLDAKFIHEDEDIPHGVYTPLLQDLNCRYLEYSKAI